MKALPMPRLMRQPMVQAVMWSLMRVLMTRLGLMLKPTQAVIRTPRKTQSSHPT
jgi:hypothetical protein